MSFQNTKDAHNRLKWHLSSLRGLWPMVLPFQTKQSVMSTFLKGIL